MQYVQNQVVEKTAPEQVLNPTRIYKPAFLLNVPFSYSTNVANNIWMEELSDEERKPDCRRAMRQFLDLYHFLAADSLVFLLPAPGDCNLQDLVFTANIGIVLQHLPDENTVVLSNFTSEPRRGETDVGVQFFESLGYDAYVPPFRFEGEAELKHLHDNVYIGGYGTRSEIETYSWMEKTFGMKIIKLLEDDPYLYHLDCTVFPVTRDTTLVCTEMYEKETIREIEKETDIIDVSVDACYSGICNSVRLGNTILNASNIHDMKPNHEHYFPELEKNRRLEDIAVTLGFEVSYFNLSEFMKGGALLSCMVMHLNRNSYEFTLI
jgi:N-dimethylarginine dimethylaminohydrolase